MNPQRKYYLKVSIAILIFGLSIFGLEILGYKVINDKQSEINQSEYKITKFGLQEDTLSLLKRRYKAIEYDEPVVNTALPSAKETDKLLSDLDSLANQSKLKLTVLEAVTSGTTAEKKAQTDLSLRQTIKGKYSYELPLNIKLEGGFTSYVLFLKKIENYQRLINISTMEIAKKASVTDTSSDLIEAKLKITAYLQK